MKKEKLLSNSRILGLIMIAVGFGIYYFRPLASCSWWNIFCQGGSLLITPLFVIFSMIIILSGAYKLIKG